jgi:2',3'-cyclic-nucleotide 2'-phosphodiesterase (5'-nucleotidase family)
MTQSLKPQPADGRSRTRESSGPEVSRLLLRERSNWPQYSFLIAVLATIGLAVAGCGGDATSDGPAAIIVSGDTAGWIVPCGCAVNQSGGLPRRGSFISRAVHDADVLYLDAGGAPGGTSAYDQLKFRFILEGERAMGLAVHNVGAAELALGADALRRLARQTQVNFLCANAFDANGNPIGEPWTAVDVAGRAVLVVGVISETFAGPDVAILAPRRRILDVLDDRAGADDFIVVLAYVPEDELRELAGNLPEVDLIVGGPC